MYTEQYNRLWRRRLDWQTEEEVRLGWITEMQNALNITFHAERGRSDADYNQVIIEFKNVGLFHGSATSVKFVEAMEELSRYIPAKAHEDGIDIKEYIGIAIDGESIAFAYIHSEGGPIVHGPIMPVSPSSVNLVFEACKQASRRAVTAENLIEDFGHGSITGGRLMQALSNSLMLYLDAPENNKVKMLYEEWKALYGQVADLSTFQIDAIIRTIGFTYTNAAPDKLSRILFVIHTFDSILIKLLAAEIVSHRTELTAYSDFAHNALSVNSNELVALLDCDIEHSQLYSRANIHGFVEEPLFSWYIDVCKMNVNQTTSEHLNSNYVIGLHTAQECPMLLTTRFTMLVNIHLLHGRLCGLNNLAITDYQSQLFILEHSVVLAKKLLFQITKSISLSLKKLQEHITCVVCFPPHLYKGS